mmetsp:Transcript_27963/g.36002  ORF Transcript_27963/g.36002 Transcript_27963/m.36002 type:complete len:263 (-) Transcript_27963:36-824(-)
MGVSSSLKSLNKIRNSLLTSSAAAPRGACAFQKAYMVGNTPAAETLAVNQSALAKRCAVVRSNPNGMPSAYFPPGSNNGTILLNVSTALSRTTVSSMQHNRSRVGSNGMASYPGTNPGTNSANCPASSKRISSSSSLSSLLAMVSFRYGMSFSIVSLVPMASPTILSFFMASTRASVESLDSCATKRSKGGIERRALESQLRERARVRDGVVPEASGPAIGAWPVVVAEDPSSAILLYLLFLICCVIFKCRKIDSKTQLTVS